MLFVFLLAGLSKKFSSDFYETLQNYGLLLLGKLFNFGVDPLKMAEW